METSYRTNFIYNENIMKKTTILISYNFDKFLIDLMNPNHLCILYYEENNEFYLHSLYSILLLENLYNMTEEEFFQYILLNEKIKIDDNYIDIDFIFNLQKYMNETNKDKTPRRIIIEY